MVTQVQANYTNFNSNNLSLSSPRWCLPIHLLHYIINCACVTMVLIWTTLVWIQFAGSLSYCLHCMQSLTTMFLNLFDLKICLCIKTIFKYDICVMLYFFFLYSNNYIYFLRELHLNNLVGLVKNSLKSIALEYFFYFIFYHCYSVFTWSCLTVTPFAGHQDFNYSYVCLWAGLTAGKGNRKISFC